MRTARVARKFESAGRRGATQFGDSRCRKKKIYFYVEQFEILENAFSLAVIGTFLPGCNERNSNGGGLYLVLTSKPSVRSAISVR